MELTTQPIDALDGNHPFGCVLTAAESFSVRVSSRYAIIPHHLRTSLLISFLTWLRVESDNHTAVSRSTRLYHSLTPSTWILWSARALPYAAVSCHARRTFAAEASPR